MNEEVEEYSNRIINGEYRKKELNKKIDYANKDQDLDEINLNSFRNTIETLNVNIINLRMK